MHRQEFTERCRAGLLLLDGATGTELIKRGMPRGVCPEKWVLENPHAIRDVQQACRTAGSDIVYACTFGANRMKLAEFGLADSCHEMNRELARISKDAVGTGLVFGDIAPTGSMVEPFGELAFEEAVDVYRQQMAALIEGGVDGFVIETMMDIQEARAALIAARELCDLPVMVSMTYGEDGRTLTGTDPLSALITLQALGADAVGCNCSTGPANMLEFVKLMKPYAKVPLLAKPNAGQPKLVNGETVFDMDAEEFASFLPKFIAAGVNLFGGCCGTTPEYIAAVKQAAGGLQIQPPLKKAISAVSSARAVSFMGEAFPVAVVGERINPTGKKKLKEDLREGKFSLVRQFATEQTSAGAALLDVNMGMSGIDEKAMMLQAVSLLSRVSDTPLCLDSSNPEVMEAALRLYPGRALVNSISAEKARLEKMLPVAAKYGAMIILLPLTDDEIPPTAAGRAKVVEQLFAEAQKYGYEKEDVAVDGLVMAVSADQSAASETIKTVEWASKEFGVNTIIGASNVSFGLPARNWINAAFFAMAIGRGLSMVIINPMEELIMSLKLAGDALTGRDKNMLAYLARFADAPKEAATAKATSADPKQAVHDCVVRGEEDNITGAVKAALAAGAKPSELVDNFLIPAINKVGELFDRKKYFLPQLMMSADTMRKAFAVLEPLLKRDGTQKAAEKIVIATVKGDIHDIGKNLVALMLRNYGFDVIDLGKDVPAEKILDAAEAEGAKIVGLSALMTTTMIEMKTVIDLAKARGLSLKFMIGGAVVDENYSREIGANGYGADALASVRLAQEWLRHPHITQASAKT
jgi:5-methyltetrahydrofolate--homocysteine methyltransferase